MSEGAEERFAGYVDGLAGVIGHADRVGPLRDYCTGLMLPVERKSVEPLAAVTSPARVAAQHQSLLHFVGQAAWSDEKVLARVGELVLPAIEAHGPIEAWIVDDTGFRKKGRHSVGVARQYCGEVGKQDNCQVAVSLSLANGWASLPVAFRLYLPQEWSADAERCRKAGVPGEVGFATKPQIALDQIRRACERGLPRGVVLADAGYGNDARFRLGVVGLGLSYVVGILPNALVFDPAAGVAADRPPPRRGRREDPEAISAREIALGLSGAAWRRIEWREGSAEVLASRFARVRLRSAHRHPTPQGRAAEWLLIEWPEGEPAPTKYWLSSLSAATPFERLVELAKLRWRIERDYQELKQELGLDHFEGRGWRGLHHHATLCIAAYGFLVSERDTIPPSGVGSPRHDARSAFPGGYRPRGAAAPARTAHPQLDCNDATPPYRRPRRAAAALSLLR